MFAFARKTSAFLRETLHLLLRSLTKVLLSLSFVNKCKFLGGCNSFFKECKRFASKTFFLFVCFCEGVQRCCGLIHSFLYE